MNSDFNLEKDLLSCNGVFTLKCLLHYLAAFYLCGRIITLAPNVHNCRFNIDTELSKWKIFHSVIFRVMHTKLKLHGVDAFCDMDLHDLHTVHSVCKYNQYKDGPCRV